MDYLTVIKPTLWLNFVFGLYFKKLGGRGVEESIFLKCYHTLVFFVDKSLQMSWFIQYFYYKLSNNQIKNFQQIILIFCVVCNVIVSFLPARALLSNGGELYNKLYRLHRYERTALRSKPSTFLKFLVLNLLIIVVGISVPSIYMTLEASGYWSSYSVGEYTTFMDVTALYGGYIRQLLDLVFFDGYFMFVIIYGLSYAKINEFLICCRRRGTFSNGRSASQLIIRKLKFLQEVDNTLSDFYREIMKYYSWYCIVIIILTFLNWYYVVGYFLLGTSPRFVSYPSWVVYFMLLFFGIIGGSVFAKYQADKTGPLLGTVFIDNDDPDVLEQVEILSLQLLHRNEEFDMCGLFKLDISLLISMTGTVATYVIILKQFENIPNVPSKQLN